MDSKHQQQRVTLAAVAKAAGLSIYSASCALRGVGALSDATRKRVLESARRLGYRPNAPAVLLALQRRRSRAEQRQPRIAWLADTGTATHRAFVEACVGLGLEAVAIDPREFHSPQAASRALWQQGIGGIFLDRTTVGSDRIASPDFEWQHFAVVKETRTNPGLRFHIVRQDAFDYMIESLTQVFGHGYQRVAVLLSPAPAARDHLAQLGALYSFEQCLLPPGTVLEWRLFSPSPPYGQPLPDEAHRWVVDFAPDAVVGYPFGWGNVLERSGFRVPQEIAFADVVTYARFTDAGQFAGCDTRDDEVVKHAVRHLHRLLQTGEFGMVNDSMEDVVEPLWIDGPSLPQKPVGG